MKSVLFTALLAVLLASNAVRGDSELKCIAALGPLIDDGNPCSTQAALGSCDLIGAPCKAGLAALEGVTVTQACLDYVGTALGKSQSERKSM